METCKILEQINKITAMQTYRLLSNLDNNSSFVRTTKNTLKEINMLSYWDSQQQIQHVFEFYNCLNLA